MMRHHERVLHHVMHTQVAFARNSGLGQPGTGGVLPGARSFTFQTVASYLVSAGLPGSQHSTEMSAFAFLPRRDIAYPTGQPGVFSSSRGSGEELGRAQVVS